jgi:hypothetical protein
VLQQRTGAGQWPHLGQVTAEALAVSPLQLRGPLRVELASGLAQQRVDEETAAHSDPAVDPPHGELYAEALEGLPPGEDVLVDAVHQGAIQVEKKGGPEVDRVIVHR